MAKKIYDKKITKTTDWGGDNSTGGLPVAGGRVQEFIKESLNNLENDLGKISDVGKNKYGYSRIVDEKFLQQFADKESAKLYDQNPVKNENLLLNSVQLPGTGETVAIMRVTVLEAPAEYTTNGVAETFMFRYLSYYNDETDLSPVRGAAVLTVNNVERQRIELRSGSTYTLDVTKYLTEEKNTVQVTVTNNEGSTRNFVYDVNIVTLNVSSSFDDTAAYKGVVSFRYTPIGNIMKTVHFILDGTEIHTEETTANNRQLTYDIPAQKHGAHLLKVFLTADVMGNKIQSNTLTYDVICVEEGNMTPVIASPFSPVSVKQYETITVPFVVYDPAGSPTTIGLHVNGKQVSERSIDRTRQTWVYRANDKGELTLRITCKEVMKDFIFDITESVVTSEAETQDLELYLTSQGRSNQDINKEEWAYKNIVATFTGMNWITNGWVTDAAGSVCLRLSGGATANIPLKVFTGNILQTGKTLELEFSVREITNYKAVILSCLAGGIGLQLTPNSISLTSEQSKVAMQYKEGERVRVSFVIEKMSNNRLMQIFVNGIKSQSFQYPDTDGFTQNNPVGITIDSSTATIDLYNIRVYSNNLNTSQLLNNYIADIDDIEKKIAVFERNQVYDSYGNLDMNALNKQIPVMLITGTLPNYKGDKQNIVIEYIDVKKVTKSFTADGCQLDVQGTSSQYYPRKNYKFKAKNGFEMSQGGHADAFTLNEEECLPATVFCVKADFAESSGTHNTGIADYVGWLLREANILTEPQKQDPKIRTTVYGEPCVIFHRKDENSIAEFIGKYNFNTDKGAENTFGFAAGDESWEFLNNTSDIALFKSADFAKWKETLEARYPEEYENITRVQQVFEWVVSCKGNTEKFKTELEQYFDKKQLIFYYLMTFVFGMVDQRAKNQFLTVFGKGGWLFIFYDNDTCMGINNEGAISFSYNIEIHDTIGTLDVWNGAKSELWILVENAFADDIRQLYYDLRQKNLLSYNKVIEYTNERQSDKWCEAVYNEDGYFKYERPLIEGYEDWSSGAPVMTKTGAYLYALQGSRDAHRRWWLFNRFKYLDSKYQAGSSLSDYATFRTYTPSEWAGVAPKADITIKTFVAMYGTVKWGSVTKSVRMNEGETKTITAPEGAVFNDTETIIYNASMIASLGDLSPLYPGTVDVSKMTNLTELIIGSSKNGYKNTNFKVLSVGTNHVLRKLDIRNCPNFTDNIEVSACEAIEEIYATGTGTTAVNLAEGGSLRVLQLPATITNLTLKNQLKLTDSGLQLNGVANLVAIVVEKTPSVNGYELVKRCLTGDKLSRIRLVGIQANDVDLSNVKKMAALNGINEAGKQTEQAIITGTLHVREAYVEDLEWLNEIYPDLIITYDTLVQIPTRTIIVRGQDTQNILVGAKVIINGQEYVTDDNGQVKVETGQKLEVTLEADGYMSKATQYATSTVNTTNTIWLDKIVVFTIKVVDQYNSVLKNVPVVFNGEKKVTGDEGTAVFDTSKGTYAYSATYRGETQTGSVTIEQADKTESFSFDRAIEDFKPEPNGNIQMLVKRYSSSSPVVSLSVTSSTTDYVIDWGDGTTTPATGTGAKTYEHSYANDIFYNLEVRNCAEVTKCNMTNTSSNNYCLYAYWTIGNSKVNDLNFKSFSYLVVIGQDLFWNDTYRTSFRDCFSSCQKLASIPTGLFDNCTRATEFGYISLGYPYGCFDRCWALTSIPAGLFDNCTKVTSFAGCFASCSAITSIPAGLFDNCKEVTSFAGCFDSCSAITSIPAGLFDNCPNVKEFGHTYSSSSYSELHTGCFDSCSKITSIPTGLFDNCKEVTSFASCFASCSKITSIPTGLFDNCKEVTSFASCFSYCQTLQRVDIPTFPKITSTSKWKFSYYYCTDLAIIVAPQEIPQPIDSDTFYSAGSSVTGGFKIYVPDGSVEAYKTATNWSKYADRIYPMSELPE